MRRGAIVIIPLLRALDAPGPALLQQVLEHAGCSVWEASESRKGLRRFRERPTALVITDMLMPDEDGLEVTMAVRRESPTVKLSSSLVGQRRVTFEGHHTPGRASGDEETRGDHGLPPRRAAVISGRRGLKYGPRPLGALNYLTSFGEKDALEEDWGGS